jgi:hypothetical protein
MIKSAAIVKTKTLAPWKELRLQKRKLKKSEAAERKATKQIRPSSIGRREVVVVSEVVVEFFGIPVDESPVTREEMLQQAEVIGLKVDKRWSDATLLKHIEELQWATKKDNS